jgi:hypothetical protein
MRRHVSAEALALYREGEVSARRAAGIASHLSRCSACSGIVGDLANVSALLTATPLPPMPDRLVARIEAAIAGESALRAASSPVQAPHTLVAGADAGVPGGAAAGVNAAGVNAGGAGADRVGAGGAGADRVGAGGAGAGGFGTSGAREDSEPGRVHIPGRPDLPERASRGTRRFRMPRLSSPILLRTLAATGAVVIIAGAGFLLANGKTATDSSGTSSGNAAPAARPSARNAHGGQRSAGPVPTYVNYRLHGKVVTADAIASHTNFTKASLATQVRRDVASSSATFAGAQPATVSGPAKSSIGGVSLSRLEGCLDRVAAGRTVLLANVARYIGSPATIIVLRSLTAADVLDVTIVGLSCSASNSEVISRTTVPER